MTTSVIIPTHNRHAGLDALLRDLTRQDTTEKLEVLVVDSEAGESPQHVVDKYADAGLDVKLVYSENVLATKRNVGAANAAGSTLLFLDDDLRIPPHFVRAHEDAQSVPGVVVSSQIVFPRDWIKTSNYYRYKNSRHFNAYSGRPAPAELAPNNYVAMAFSINADDYHRIGGTDEDFRLYGGEDVEFGFRSAREGLRHIYEPEALAVHAEVDMDVYVFAAKVYKASYHGQQLVLDKVPEANTVRTYRVMEPSLQTGLADKAIGRTLKLAASPAALRILLKGLDRADGKRSLYFPAGYHAVLLLASTLGVKDRDAGRPDRSDAIRNMGR